MGLIAWGWVTQDLSFGPVRRIDPYYRLGERTTGDVERKQDEGAHSCMTAQSVDAQAVMVHIVPHAMTQLVSTEVMVQVVGESPSALFL